MSLESVIVETVAEGVGLVVRKLLESNPSAAEKVESGKRMLLAAVDLIPEDELHAFLTETAKARAEAAFRAAKLAKVGGEG